MDPMEVDEAVPALFAQCRFALVRGNYLPIHAADKLAATLRLHGGEILDESYGGENLPLGDLTHIVCGSYDFPSYNAASDALIPAIKPQWVYASLAKSKLANPRQYSADPRLFMSDVVICCADLPEGDKDAIIGGVLAMGGLHSAKVASMVTHIVALTTDSDVCRNVAKRRLNIKIVLPHWFDDCLKLGRRIDESPYLLPDPEILRPSTILPPKAAGNGSLNGAINPDPCQSSSLTSHLSPRGPLHIFANKRVMFSQDLGIGSHLKDVLKGLIEESKGQMIENAKKADMFICKYREGPEYRTASLAGKDVGNLAWLYYLITNNSWTSPTRRLLHYPVARGGLPGFSELRISLSNYSGDARLYLENLIFATGAECTKTLKQDNTHLITAHNVSEKCAAASEWGVHIINHLWLEESYAKWRMQSLTNSRYTHFPPRTNLGEVVGQTNLDRCVLEQAFFHHQEDVKTGGDQVLPQVLQDRDLDITNGTVKSPRAVDIRAHSADSDAQGRATPCNAKFAIKIPEPHKMQTPRAGRMVSNGKENQTPTTTSSRKSKETAAARLHDLAPDIALYEKERKRVGGVVHGGLRKNDVDRVKTGQKRSVTADDWEATESRDPKRSRTRSPSLSMHLLVSGYKKWVARPKVEADDCNALRDLGIILTLEPSRATHLAAPSILRTRKFISAMAYAPTIISTAFIDKCLDEDKLLDPEDFLLKDEANEKNYRFSLIQSQKRAKENNNRLFQGWVIFCVENINGGFDTFKSIIEANGGQCNKYRGRPGTTVPSRPANSGASSPNDDDDDNDRDAQTEVLLISGSEGNQNRLWFKFRQMVEGGGKTAKIVSPDWLLSSAMSQKIEPVGPHEVH